ncbi:MAG: class I SAM-dependent methyltransferase [Proteobacteria bacterium]|nr:class I SAM-dependent methyltransferase [Pseudomonadota bacterium]MCH9047910.1 class I SAM-dependent methyltransferase [Pseudomonadota bacterium]
MQRITEPELMNDEAQARAYAQANFDEPHNMFIQAFDEAFPKIDVSGHILDLGCGSADISIRFAQSFPDCVIDGLDGAPQMLAHGKLAIQKAQLEDRIHLILGRLPGASLPDDHYEVIMSNSLLHHLHEPDVLWESIKQFGVSGSRVFIMDLMRPESEQVAREFVDLYASGEPQVLKDDFYHSLCAAFLPEEIQSQLECADLSHFKIKVISDRHVIVFGVL